MSGTPAVETIDIPSPGPCGLREQKKRQTRRELHHAVLQLILDEGLDNLTVDRIAAAAGVSSRTFFNYFPTKEAAILGLPPDLDQRLREALDARPADEGPWQSIMALAQRLLERQSDDQELRHEVIRRYPKLVHSMRAATNDARETARSVLAERMKAQGMDSIEARRRAIVYIDLAMTLVTSSMRISQLEGVETSKALVEVRKLVRALGDDRDALAPLS